jgi:hypothetical protein
MAKISKNASIESGSGRKMKTVAGLRGNDGR